MSYQLPQTRIFQTFGESTAIRTSSLAPCIVAPFYDVHEDIDFGQFTSAAVTYPYVGLSGDDTITESDISDGVFKAFLKNAQVQGYSPIEGQQSDDTEAGYLGADNKSLFTGMVVANGGGYAVPAGFPALKVGDTVTQTADGASSPKAVFKIAGFQQASVAGGAISLPTFNTYGDHLASDITLGGTQSCASNVLLKFVITAGGLVSDGNVTATLYVNGAAVQTGIACGSSAVSLSGYTGITTLTVAFATTGTWVTGDSITFGLAGSATATAQYNQGYSVVILDSEATLVEGDTFTLYYSAGDVVDPTGAEWNQEGLKLSASLTKGGISIYSGEACGTYRIRKNEYTEKVYNVSSTSELKGLLGDIHPLNPLSMMCQLALLNSDGAGICFVAVAADNAAGYSKALDAIGMNNESWSIVPYSEDTAIQELVVARAKEYSSPAVMNWKTAWLGADVADEETVLPSLAGSIGTYDSGSPATSKNLYVTDTATYDISKVKYGDIVLNNGNQYVVMSVFTAVLHPYIMLDTSLPTGNVSGFEVIRKVTAADKADEIRRYANSLDSERVRLFFADGPYLTGWPEQECPMSYLAAAWAGKRAGAAPHQPLTRATISGIACRGNGGFTVDLMNEMAEAGTWLTVTDNDGTTYCRHQLTTKDSDENYNLKEDSKVSNADEISMTFRSSLDSYYGRANVTDTALEVIRLKAEEIVLSIQGRSWSSLLGPQITGLSSLTIERDPSFSDRVNLYVSMTTPDPLNNLDVYLNIQ